MGKISTKKLTSKSGDQVQVRFGGSSNAYEGYVEINVNGQGWKGVCDDSFDMDDAQVICRMAGFEKGAAKAHIKSQPFGYGSSKSKFAADNLECKGDEANIGDCKRNAWNDENCSIKEWAGVTCVNQEVSLLGHCKDRNFYLLDTNIFDIRLDYSKN